MTKCKCKCTRRFWSTLCFHLPTSFMEMLISFSSRTLAPAHTAKTTSKCFADHDITVLDRPVNMPDLNPIRYLWDIFKRKMRNSGSNNTDELKAVPQADPCHTALMLESVLKEPRSNIECRNELYLFCFENPFLIDFRKLSNILRCWIFDFHDLVSSNHQN